MRTERRGGEGSSASMHTQRLSDAKCDGLSTVPSCLPSTHRHWATQSKCYKGPDQPHKCFSVHPFSHPTIFIKHLLCARSFAGYYGEPRQTCLCTHTVHSTLGNKGTPTLTKQSNKCKIIIVRSTRKEKFMVLKENVLGFFSPIRKGRESTPELVSNDEERWPQRSRRRELFVQRPCAEGRILTRKTERTVCLGPEGGGENSD